MNIEMINNQSANRAVDMDKSQYSTHSSYDSRMKTKDMGYSLDITGKVMENAAYGKEELKSVQDIAQAAGNQNVTLQRNYAAVMSNSMSAKDYAQLTKDGVNPANTQVTESVTNLDKIKIKMAEAGITITGYNDDLSSDEISAVVANAGLADSISKSLQAMDLPVNDENIAAMEEVVSLSKDLTPMSDEAIKYMLINDLEPTVENIYKAEYSSGSDNYFGHKDSNASWEELRDQAAAIVEKSNVDNEAGIDEAKWIVENDVPLTVDSIESYDEIVKIEFPISQDVLLKAMTVAIEEGKEPKEANVLNTESLYEKAVRLVNDFANMDDGGDITKRRQLEEIRLAMSAEANLTLLRKGIQIETQPLEELVDKLKQAEKEFYRPVLLDDNNDNNTLSVEEDALLSDRIELYKSTRSAIEELYNIPVKTVADVVSCTDVRSNDFNVSELVNAGQVAKSVYEKAGQSYETLMTAPRADMGDSIKKAFANVDDILNDIGMDVNDANRKAVRTLGYAQMEITKESIDDIREVTNTVKSVISMMTPAKTLQMIREGHNPLSENIYDLEKSLMKEEPMETADKYSQFLVKLEKNGQITEDEKAAYIGMFRLFNQIEKQDGKIIGNVLASGMELTMQNMLSASRSNRHKNMDVKIDDDFGVLEDIVAKGESISEQISRGFADIMAEPISEKYVEDRLNDVKKATKASQTAEEILSSLNEPATVENIIAVSDMIALGGKQYKKLFDDNSGRKNDESEGSDFATEEMLSDDDIERLINDFNDSASAKVAYDNFSNKAMNVAKLKMDTSDSYIDVREWMLTFKQIGLSASMGRSETYDIPVKINDEYTAIHLTVKSGNEESGKVTASFESDKYGRVEAQFTVKDTGVDGFVVTDSRSGLQELKSIEGQLRSNFADNNIKTSSLSFVYGRNVQESDYLSTVDNAKATNKELYSIAKAFIVALAQ